METNDKTISAVRLRELIDEAHPKHFWAFRDLFATGCLLHAQGQHRAGRKLVREVIDTVPSHGNKTYLLDLRDALAGNEFRFGREIEAHAELNELLDQERARQAQLEPDDTALEVQS